MVAVGANVLTLLAVKLLLAVLLMGCADDLVVQRIPAADAAPIDACIREPSHGCCALLPDEDAVRACATAGVEPGLCGVIACFAADCTLTQLPFCT